MTGVPWRYAERGWRHLYWVVGTLLSQLEVAAASAGLAPRIRSLFPDAAVTALVGADPVLEFPLFLLTFGDQDPAIGATGPAAAGDRDVLGEPWPLAVALRGIDVPHWIAVHGVDGVAPGIYRWPELSAPVRTGDLRGEPGRPVAFRRVVPRCKE